MYNMELILTCWLPSDVDRSRHGKSRESFLRSVLKGARNASFFNAQVTRSAKSRYGSKEIANLNGDSLVLNAWGSQETVNPLYSENCDD